MTNFLLSKYRQKLRHIDIFEKFWTPKIASRHFICVFRENSSKMMILELILDQKVHFGAKIWLKSQNTIGFVIENEKNKHLMIYISSFCQNQKV